MTFFQRGAFLLLYSLKRDGSSQSGPGEENELDTTIKLELAQSFLTRWMIRG
jgi:hypothetical protein